MQKRVGHNWATELNWIFYLKDTLFYLNYIIFTKKKMEYDYCVYYYATVNNNKT